MLTKAEMEIEASMIFKYPRIAITGLPGSGKTTLAKLLLVDYEKGHNSYTMNKEYAFVQGDEILPGNIVKVCKVLNKYIAEHFYIADLLAKENVPPVDLIIVLDIPEVIWRLYAGIELNCVEIIKFKCLCRFKRPRKKCLSA